MIRLTLLLLGARPLKANWWVLLALAGIGLAAGLIFVTNFYDQAISVTIDIIGAVLMLEGVLRLLALASIGFPNAVASVIKSLGFFALGVLAGRSRTGTRSRSASASRCSGHPGALPASRGNFERCRRARRSPICRYSPARSGTDAASSICPRPKRSRGTTTSH